MDFNIIKGRKNESLKLTDEEYKDGITILSDKISHALKIYKHTLHWCIREYLSTKPFNDTYVYFALDNKIKYIKIGYTHNVEEQMNSFKNNNMDMSLTAIITTKGHFNKLIVEELRDAYISHYKGNGWYNMTEKDVEEFIVCEWFDCEEDDDGLKHYNYDIFHLTDVERYYNRILNNFDNICTGKHYIKLKGIEACYKSLKADYDFIEDVLSWCKANKIKASYLDEDTRELIEQYIV